jgi:hypothetical protein
MKEKSLISRQNKFANSEFITHRMAVKLGATLVTLKYRLFDKVHVCFTHNMPHARIEYNRTESNTLEQALQQTSHFDHFQLPLQCYA